MKAVAPYRPDASSEHTVLSTVLIASSEESS